MKMNSKNITLFNYVYSNSFENEKDDDLKWNEFKEICQNKMNYVPYDFIEENNSLVTYNKKGMWVDLLGNKEAIGKFVILNFLGQKEFINYKVNEIKSIISNYGNKAFDNLENTFEYMCNEAIREILIECRNKDLILFDNNIFKYFDDRLGIILFDNIEIIISKKENNLNGNNIYINNSGQFVNQLGNNNMANIKINDEQLFALLNDKMEALKTEMQNKNCEDKIKELEEAIKNKDKKSALEIISQLAGIGSFIATGISMFL